MFAVSFMLLMTFGLFVVSLAVALWWVIALVEAASAPDPAFVAAGQSKVVAVLLMLLVPFIGLLIYWFAIRPPVRRVMGMCR